MQSESVRQEEDAEGEPRRRRGLVNLTPPEFDAERFSELVLYVAQKFDYDASFDASRMAAALFYCDFLAYRVLGHALAGATYLRMPYGPGADEYEDIQEKLIERKDAALKFDIHGGEKRQRLVALRRADVTKFTSAEVELIDQVLEDMRGLSSVYVTNPSRQHVGWLATRKYQPIPYATAWLADEMDEASLAFADDVASRLSAVVA